MASKPSTTGPNATRRSLGPDHILVVDDFEPWRRSVCSMLAENAEWEVVAEAADGLEAIQKVQIFKPDLILLDLGLPTLNGLEAATQIRQVLPEAKILFLTAINDRDVMREALNTGAQGYVLKIDAHTQLLSAVAAVLGGDDFVSSGIKPDDSSDSGET